MKNRLSNLTLSHYDLVARAFTVVEISQPIKITVSPEISLLPLWEEFMEKCDIREDWCCLVRDNQHIFGYISFEDPLFDQQPLEGNAGDEVIPIKPEMIVSSSLPLLDLLPLFEKSFFYFVLTGNDITHVVSFYDLDKLPMKFCLFAIFMELESQIIGLLSSDSAIGKYLNSLSEQRLAKARTLCKIKYKEETPSKLLLCTTFVDKKEILKKTTLFQDGLPFENKRKLDSFFKEVEAVRNQIAHGDSIFEILRKPKDFNALIVNLRKTIAAISTVKKRQEVL